MDGLLLFIGVCILNSLRQLVEYYFSQGLTKPLLTIPYISIHTPVKGVTYQDVRTGETVVISIHTPVKGVTLVAATLDLPIDKFQSTLP